MLQQVETLGKSIDAIDAARDIDVFIRAHATSNEPPQCVISAQVYQSKQATREVEQLPLWSEESNSSDGDSKGSVSTETGASLTPSDDDAQYVLHECLPFDVLMRRTGLW
jgi:carbamoylphosphate synthase large subunit